MVHQCAQFSVFPKIEHVRAIWWLGRYLGSTKDQGMILHLYHTKRLEVFVDADFAGNWDPSDTARPGHGYVIKYADCPIIWKSQMQREIALSSTESEYTGISYSIRELIPIINILEDISKYHNLPQIKPKLHVKVYEDNVGQLKWPIITNTAQERSTSILDHIISENISLPDQDTDIFTKPRASQQFSKLRKRILGW